MPFGRLISQFAEHGIDLRADELPEAVRAVLRTVDPRRGAVLLARSPPAALPMIDGSRG